MTHFYDEVYSLICFFEDNECQCPLGLMTHFYRDRGARAKRRKEFVSMPSRANDSFLRLWSSLQRRQRSVSMPSRANDSFLLGYVIYYNSTPLMCQCPLGLMTHFYHWQLFLSVSLRRCVSMPSRANDSFLLHGEQWERRSEALVSMPSRANDSFLQYPFKNLGFMRFPEPVFAGICLNILTDPHFHTCLQFGHI